MFLVADSGGTSTRWMIIEKKRIRQIRGIGLNPNSVSHQLIRKELLRIRELLPSSPEKVFFYGAGCRMAGKKKIIKSLLQKCLDTANVMVETDLLGASRGMAGKRKALVGILGTGSNAGRYDGKKIISMVRSMGYKKGDEGSAAWIGKQLPMNPKNKNKFQGRPAALYGSLARFAYINFRNPDISETVKRGFREYVRKYIMPLEPQPDEWIYMTGGVAWNFRKQLSAVIREFLPNEILYYREYTPGLVEYHLQSRS